MKKIALAAAVYGAVACSPGGGSNHTASSPVEQPQLNYPETRKVDTVDTYWGTEVPDPYRWLEDDRSEETGEWVKAQNKVTRGYLDQIPFRGAIRNRLEDIFNYPKVGAPRKVGDYYFISKNDGLQNQNVTYYKFGEEGEEKVFLDPNTMSANGTVTASLSSASHDEKYIAYSYQEAGSDWAELRVRDIEKNEDLEDRVQWVKFSGATWHNDGFYYSRFPVAEGSELSEMNTFHSIYYHKLGTPQEEDKLIYINKENGKLYHGVGITEDQSFLSLSASFGTEGNEIYIKDLKAGETEFKPLITGFAFKSSIVDNTKDGMLLVRTNVDAPNYRLVKIDPNNPAKEHWVDVIPEEENLLQGVAKAGGNLFPSYLEKACTKIYRMDYAGQGKKEIAFPGPGSAGGFYGKHDAKKVYYSYSSFTYPGTIFEYDLDSEESTEYYRPELKFDPAAFESKQVMYKSKDGTEVSMFIVHKKGLKLDGTNPTLLYAYGGFNISMRPSFSVSNMILLENGGVYALANLRGGGEYGEDWHRDGMMMKKQNVFDDFISAGEYLIAEGYTTKDRLAIMGGSNGGLLVGACMAQRPDLFRVAFPMVGVMDMLRYQHFTVGHGWVPEFGSSEQSKEMFEYIYGYSPLHNLKEGTAYPATMVMTADHDDRVVPAHSFKFAAELQAKHEGDNPVLIRIESDAGHGAGKPISKIIDEHADRWSFMLYNMGVTAYAH